jgi:hypothetical protein
MQKKYLQLTPVYLLIFVLWQVGRFIAAKLLPSLLMPLWHFSIFGYEDFSFYFTIWHFFLNIHFIELILIKCLVSVVYMYIGIWSIFERRWTAFSVKFLERVVIVEYGRRKRIVYRAYVQGNRKKCVRKLTLQCKN